MQKLRFQPAQNPQQTNSISRNFSLSGSTTERNPIPLDQLMLHLSRYRELKQLPLNPVSEPKEQLWRDSPCTVRCPQRNVSLDRIERFNIGSIYHKDNINEQKKVFTESEKPELMLKNFRRQIQQATHSTRKYGRRFSQASSEKAKINMKMGKTMPLIENKFYKVPTKVELKYDRNGARSTFKGQYDVKTIIDKFRQTKPNFTSSRRIDLALPLNFNPGPGNYFTKSEQFPVHHSNRSRRFSSKVNLNPESQRQHTIDFIKEA